MKPVPDHLLEPAAVLEIQRACEALNVSYARALDFRDQEGVLELFTDDAVLTLQAPLHAPLQAPLRGREAIAGWLAERDPALHSRHVLSNFFIDVLDTRHARGIAYVTVYRSDAPARGGVPAAAVGHYEDRFLNTAAGWRFAAKTLHVAFPRRRSERGRG